MECAHRLFRVEQALVHVDVDDLGAVLDLLARDLDGCGIIARHDQLLEAGRTGTVGALADIDEGSGLMGHFTLDVKASARPGWIRRRGSWFLGRRGGWCAPPRGRGAGGGPTRRAWVPRK